jgi:hypothetical protein
VSVAAQNACGQSAFTTLSINALAAPTISVSGNFNICIGNSTSLNASGATTYSWNTGASTSAINVAPVTTTNYTVTGVNSNNCSASVVKTVTVSSNQAPALAVAGPTNEVCEGQSVNLAANGASTYTWSPGNINGFFVTVTFTVTTTYTVVGTAANGCTNSATYTQSVSTCTGFDPTVSGSSDLRLYPNPVLSELIIEGSRGIKSLEIYNVIGELITSKDLSSEKEAVDVSSLAPGVYFAKLTGNSNSVIFKLIKE